MNFETQLPEWENEGTEPSADLKTNGFKEGYKPPASIFNFWWAKVSKAIKEIQTNLSNVDNTKDSEKSVKFASEAGIGRKLKYALTVRFKGGQTEGTDLWTFDGSTSRSINITPDKIGAANKDEVIKIVDAVTEDGATYTATVPDITELKNGMELTIIPSASNTNLSPRLVINGIDKAIRIGHSFNYAATNALKTNYLQAGRPVKLKYDANCNLGTQGQGAWIFTDKQKTSAQDLYGTVPIESGGTGASTAEEALANLGVVDYMIERGVDNGWQYTKWASGEIECYKSIPYDIETEDVGNVYCGQAAISEALPDVLIVEKSIIPHCSLYDVQTYHQWVGDIALDGHNINWIDIYCQNSGALSGKISVKIKGSWK